MKTFKLLTLLFTFLVFSTAVYAQGGCNDFRYYYADIANSGATDIYEVTLTGAGDADLVLIAQSAEEVHIALSEATKLLYLVRKSDGAISIIDPLQPPPPPLFALGPWNLITPSISGVVTATFDSNDELLIGSESLDEIYHVDAAFNATLYDGSSPISGGDIALDTNGDLYLVSGHDLYKNEVFPTPDVFIAQLNNAQLSTGLAQMLNGNFISSYLGSNQLLVHNSGGTAQPSYNLMLNGLPFTSNYGDLTSGCVQPPPVIGSCLPFSTFYIQHGPGVLGSDLYSVNFNPPNADLTWIGNVPFEAHIGFDPIANIVYMVDKAGTSIAHFSVGLSTVVATVPIVPQLNGITAVVFDEVSQLLIVGDMDSDQMYALNPVLGSHIPYGNANVSGGDLAIKNGTMYLASRSGNSFYEFPGTPPVMPPGLPPVLKGNMATNNVNGLAQANNATGFLTSNYGSSAFIEIDEFGALTGVFYPAMLGGAPFTFLNGDMAAGCGTPGQSQGCSDFRYYYIADNSPGIPQGSVYSGQIVGNDFVLTPFFLSGNIGHIAVSETSGNIYVIHDNGSNIKTFDQNGVLLQTTPLAGLSSATALVWHKANGTLYVGNSPTDQVYEVDPTTGNLTLFASNIPVNGGDLISTDNGELILVKREPSPQSSKVYDITSGVAVYLYDVSNSINGAALTLNGGYIMAEGDNSLSFHTYNAFGVPGVVLNSVDNIGNPFPLFDGDMASGCFDNVVPPIIGPKINEINVPSQSQLTSYPNPTTGNSEIRFITSVSGRALVEVMDMGGRKVAELFNANTSKDELNIIRYNGSKLPEGMYLYKLTTTNDVTISKLIIAR